MSIENQIEIKFSVSAEKEIELASALGVFSPNATTTLLIQSVKKVISEPATILDLGCGTGVVGIALYLQGLTKAPIYASDLSKSSVLCSRINFDRYDCVAEVRDGSLFQPWSSYRFDVIVDDISGIASGVAAVSSWFQGVPCESGEDGVDLVAEVILGAPRHLSEGGSFFFPVVSLSNVDKILKVAKECFRSVERVGRLDWPLPIELKEHLPLLKTLRAKGAVKLEERFGMALCYTEVYCAKNPI